MSVDRPSNRLAGTLLLALTLALPTARAQQAIELPPAPALTQPAEQPFTFASDGPTAPGWSRPDEIARTYFHDPLPLLFERTLALSSDLPMLGKLDWIFTGPHAGFTVELTATKVRLTQRFYDSSSLGGPSNFPEKVTREDELPYTGQARTLTVLLDAHLSIQVLVNGKLLLTQPCVFDVTRHQLQFTAPRLQHLTVAGSLLTPRIGTATVDVDPSRHHQTMLGFGGSPSIPAYEHLSDPGKKAYWEILRRYNLLLDREYPMGSELKPDLSNLDDLRDATPHYYGDNFPNSEVSSFDYSRHALALGGEVIYEMWALPNWATEAYTSPGKPVIDVWGKPVRRVARPEEYARIVVTYCRMAKERTGAAPAIVGIQNEVEQPTEVFTAMAITLRKALDVAGFQSTRIHMADASYMYLGVDRAKALRPDKAGWAAVDYTAAHEYDYQDFLANPDRYDERLRAMHAASEGKEFLATEICLNSRAYQEASYRLAFQVGQLYLKDLTELDATALMYCWLLLDVEQPNFGASRSLLVPDRMRGDVPVASSFELRVLGAFSRHVLKGMRRVDTTSSSKDLMTVGFEDGEKAALVVVNRSSEPQRLDVRWSGRQWSELERTSLYAENMASGSVPKEIVVEPGEIVTLSTFGVQ